MYFILFFILCNMHDLMYDQEKTSACLFFNFPMRQIIIFTSILEAQQPNRPQYAVYRLKSRHASTSSSQFKSTQTLNKPVHMQCCAGLARPSTLVTPQEIEIKSGSQEFSIRKSLQWQNGSIQIENDCCHPLLLHP